MDGVIILNTTEYHKFLSGWVPVIIFCVTFFMISLIDIVKDTTWEFYEEAVFFIMVIGSLLFVITFGIWGSEENQELTKYEVFVDDSVNMNEFYRKYDVLEQREYIFVVTEREEDER